MEELELLTPLSAIAVEAKRARKRSRYLSPPYTNTAIQVYDDGDKEPSPDVRAVDVLSALRAAALLSPDLEAAHKALHFLDLYRRRRTCVHPLLLHSAGDAPAAGVGRKALLNLCTATGDASAAGVGHRPLLNQYLSTATGPAPAMATPAPGSKKQQKQNPRQPPPPALIRNRKDNAAALDEVGNAKRRRRNKKAMNGTEQQEHFRNPVALVLDFAQGNPLPSRDDLLSTFRRFGSVIHSETGIVEDHRSARVVFATRAEAEAAYCCAETLGTPRLQDLPPITLNVSPPVPKLPLKDVRKNLENMILSLTHRSSSFNSGFGLPDEQGKPAMGNLVGEMQSLLAKVDKMLQRGASSTVRHH